jgi:hypothetical protein
MKGCFHNVVSWWLQDDGFASDVAMVGCALHNLIKERVEAFDMERWAAFSPSDMHITHAPRRQYEGLLHGTGPVGLGTL